MSDPSDGLTQRIADALKKELGVRLSITELVACDALALWVRRLAEESARLANRGITLPMESGLASCVRSALQTLAEKGD